MSKKSLALWAVALNLAPFGAQAQADPGIRFSGFGSVVGTRSSERDADFTLNIAQPKGPGFTRTTDFGSDSRVGLQVDLQMSQRFSAVIQGISERRHDDSFNPVLSLAHLKFQALPGLSLRAGRLPLAAYLISEYLKVGYATPWVRPPVDLYHFNPFTYMDGGDLGWQTNAGDLSISGQFFGGSTSAKLPVTGGAEVTGKGLGGLSLTLAYGAATFRSSYTRMKFSLDSPALDGPMGPYAALRTLPAPFGGNPALADQFQVKRHNLTYLSVGFTYDPGGWFLMAEGARKGGDEDQLLNNTGAYLTWGVRFGAWTPYLTVARKTMDAPTTHPNPIVNAILSDSDEAQSSYSGGLRWDMHKNIVMKVQYDRIKNGRTSHGALINPQPGFKTGEGYNVTSLGLDFLF
jgi:hypothetical protein